MKSTSHTRMLCALAATLAVESVTISAQTTKPSVGPPGAASSPSPASAGLVNDWLREQARYFDPFDLGGQFRARFVDQTYFAVPGAGATAVDFRANTPESANDFLLLLSAVSAGPVAAEKASARSGRWRRCRSWSAPPSRAAAAMARSTASIRWRCFTSSRLSRLVHRCTNHGVRLYWSVQRCDADQESNADCGASGVLQPEFSSARGSARPPGAAWHSQSLAGTN